MLKKLAIAAALTTGLVASAPFWRKARMTTLAAALPLNWNDWA